MPLPEALVSSAAEILTTSLGKLIQRSMRRSTGDRRALLDEMKCNHAYCRLVLDKQVPTATVIPHLCTQEYDRLLRGDFDFDSLNRSRIRLGAGPARKELAAYRGKHTAMLVEKIYDKIKDLQRMHAVTPGNPAVRWNFRFRTLDRRLKLLWQHVAGK